MLDQAPHFYIDHAPPDGVLAILRILPLEHGMTIGEIKGAVPSSGVAKFRSEWPRRLADLGLAHAETFDQKLRYRVSNLGVHVRKLETTDPGILPDILHYLHSDWQDSSEKRHYLWSYQACCAVSWHRRQVPSSRDLAAIVQERMREEFPNLDYKASTGARFDSTAAGRWLQWIRTLEPTPFDEDDRRLIPRIVTRYELVLLALDRAYRQRGYRYGDPVLLDDGLLDEIAAVFFLDLACCRELLERAARLDRALSLRSTFAGTSLTLQEPYTIERL